MSSYRGIHDDFLKIGRIAMKVIVQLGFYAPEDIRLISFDNTHIQRFLRHLLQLLTENWK